MALKYTGKLITGTEVFAMSEGITTTSFHVPKKSALATQMNDGERTLYIIKAGTPVPSNDADCIGLVFENWDVTDDGGNIPIAISGNVNEHYAPVTYDAACKSALKNVNFLGSNMSSAAILKIAVAPQTAAASYAYATGLSFNVTLTGDTFVDGDAADKLNWNIGCPAGWYVASITKTSTTVYAIVIKALDSGAAIPTGGRIQFDVMAQAVTGGVAPAGAISNMTND
jgi:hypothetical protein